MSTMFFGRYDGRVIVPEKPLSVPVGERLQLSVDVMPNEPGQFAELAKFAAALPESPGDLAAHHDRHLYGDRNLREGWGTAFREMAKQEGDQLLDSAAGQSSFDREEWEWQ
jgi:hypothetical protein